MEYRLISGAERARGSPDTFLLPSDGDKAAIRVGDYVKLIFDHADGAERMWVCVTAKDGDSFSGTLANQPYRSALPYGAPVEFGPDHIIEILPPS